LDATDYILNALQDYLIISLHNFGEGRGQASKQASKQTSKQANKQASKRARKYDTERKKCVSLNGCFYFSKANDRAGAAGPTIVNKSYYLMNCWMILRNL
jgi:hypothetical protein